MGNQCYEAPGRWIETVRCLYKPNNNIDVRRRERLKPAEWKWMGILNTRGDLRKDPKAIPSKME
jgi:hypothetical protein